MGAKQSKRSVDITTTPKKGEVESPIEGEGKLEKISDLETKVTTNGAIHTEIEYADKEENEKSPEVVKENGVSDTETTKTPEGDDPITDHLNESSDVAEKSADSLEKSADSAEKSDECADSNKKNKEKTKKKKWSFRSISFSKKDKSKPGKDAEKNGDVKEVAEEGTAEENSASSPAAEVPKSENGPAEEAVAVTNGDVTAEEATKPIEPVKEEELSKPIEEPKVELEPLAQEKPLERSPSPKAEINLIQEEVADQSKIPVDESKLAESTIETNKEVRNEEIPPPLPSSNPPSPVTVFAESTMAETLPSPTKDISTDAAQTTVSPIVVSNEISEPISNSIVEPLSNDVFQNNAFPEEENDSAASPISQPALTPAPAQDPIVIEPTPEPTTCLLPTVELVDVPASSPILENVEPEPPIPQEAEQPVNNMTSEETIPEPSSAISESMVNGNEQVINADSLPDISTESLPSLPEPISESLPEPMSLPPVDCVPEPIANEVVFSEQESIPNIPSEPESVADIPSPAGEVVLTNGEANGLPSPIANDDMLPSVERAIKQVVVPTENSSAENVGDDRHDAGDKYEEEVTPVKAEE